MPRESRAIQDLLSAVQSGNVKRVKAFFDSRNKKQSRGLSLTCLGDNSGRIADDYTPVVLVAARLSDSAILKCLISNNVGVNCVGEPPWLTGSKVRVSPLHVAVNNSLSDNVAMVLDANADVAQTDHKGRTPLHLAVKRASCESCRLLLSRGATTHAADGNGVTSLQAATRYGHVELVRILLDHDAHVYQRDQRGASPLHIAAMEGHVPLIDLYSRYVDINIRATCSSSKCEQTALHLAAERGLIETIKFMVERFGADVNVLDSDQQTALHYALHRPHDYRRMRKKEDFEVTVEYLLKRRVNFLQANVKGNTALHFAAQHQFTRVVELLLVVGSDPDAKNKDNKTPSDVIPKYDVATKQLFIKYAPRDTQDTPCVTSPLSPRLLHVASVVKATGTECGSVVMATDRSCSPNPGVGGPSETTSVIKTNQYDI